MAADSRPGHRTAGRDPDWPRPARLVASWRAPVEKTEQETTARILSPEERQELVSQYVLLQADDALFDVQVEQVKKQLQTMQEELNQPVYLEDGFPIDSQPIDGSHAAT